jgi:electron transport complex protein RnfE
MKNLFNGIWSENPTFRIILGMCPTLAVSVAAINGLGMGIATTFVLIFSNVIISSLRKLIPDAIRIPSMIVIVATFVTITDSVIAAYFPELYKALGIYIPLIVVNCIILGRAEAFAIKNSVTASFWDGLGMGIGFTWALTVLAAIRELIGAGTVFGFSVFGSSYQPILMVIMPSGAFFCLALLIALFNAIEKGKNKATCEI